VNGTPAQWFYRTAGTDAAGTWKLVLVAGSPFLKPGLNKVVVNFWDQPNGVGNIIQSLSTDILYDVVGTSISGVLQPGGSMSMIAPASYVPGVPMLVRLDLKDAQGNLDRLAWTRTANLTASNGLTLNPSTITVYNGMGSALVTVGGGGTGSTTQLIQPGGTLAAPNANAPTWRILDSGADPGTAWRDPVYDDSTWRTGPLQAGAGDADERTTLNNVPGSAANTRRGFYFRNVFTVANPCRICRSAN
jgi:hypothetical protein